VNGLLGWGLALGAGAVVAWIAYPAGGQQRLRPVLAFLRFAGVAALVALVLDLVVGSAQPPAPLVALDASASWIRSGDTATWRMARDSASAAAGGSTVVLFGDSLRRDAAPATPVDAASTVTPVLQQAAAAGQRVVIVSDGRLDDGDALRQALPGSRLVVIPPRTVADRAVAELTAPSEARVGDTVPVQARIVADGPSASPATLRWLLDGLLLGESTVPALGEAGEAVIDARVVIPRGDSIGLLRAVLTGGGDAVARNDTAVVVMRRDARQRVVIVSTAPDADIRDVATAIRTNIDIPADVFYRLAPGRWVQDGGLNVVEESVVRAAARGAALAVLHGDTAAIGAPSSLGTRALFLLAPPPSDAPELLVRAAPTSPLQAALAGIVVESLPPLLAAQPARGGVVALSVSSGGPATAGTPIMTAVDGDVRRVILTAAGYSRWRARGGVSEVAFQALVGGATDWLLGARGRAAAAAPPIGVVRAGTPLLWRRGTQPTSMVRLTRDGDTRERRDSLAFGASPSTLMPALEPGVWRGQVDGVRTVIAVSASREWLPQRSALRSTTINGAAAPIRRGARSLGWLYLATVLLLAAEWLLRRRAGLR
jgi:hypothetical protein